MALGSGLIALSGVRLAVLVLGGQGRSNQGSTSA